VLQQNFVKSMIKVKVSCSVCVCVHSKKCWVVLTQHWVKYGQTQPLV